MRRFQTFFLLLTLMLSAGAAWAQPQTITLMTHDSFNIDKEVIAQFEHENNVVVRFLKGGDAGAALVQAILSKENPMADVFYGVDNTFFSRGLNADIFLPYQSPLLASIPAELKLDPLNRLLPVDYGDVCLNYDKKWFAAHKLAPPVDLGDLLKPEYRNLTVVENPATSSPGLAFLLTTIGAFGEAGYLDYWKQLKENGVKVANGWEDAYYGHFTAASNGNRPIVVSYGSSPAAEMHFAKVKPAEPPTGAVVTANNAFRQIEFVGILKGTRHEILARKLVDFMLSTTFQENIPLQMFVYPANQEAQLPEVFLRYAKIAQKPAVVAPAAIEANREKWIEAWTDIVLR